MLSVIFYIFFVLTYIDISVTHQPGYQFLTVLLILYIEINVCLFSRFCVIICWVRIDQRVGYKLTESGYETSEPGYESSGCERSMGAKRLNTGSSLRFALASSSLAILNTRNRGL